MRALLADFSHLRQAPHLKPAGIRQDRALPMHEAMQSLMCRDYLEARPQIQMKGVAEYHFGSDSLEILRRHRLDRSVGAHRHECRRLDAAARELEPAAPCRTVSSE